MANRKVKFGELKSGDKFLYDGDNFRKIDVVCESGDAGVAIQIHGPFTGKHWAFEFNELVEVKQ